MKLPTLFSKEFAGTVALVWLLLISAVAVVYVSHLNRQVFSQFQAALQERDRMDIEWSQLLLEQSAQAQHARVEQIARNKLSLEAPNAGEIVLVQW